MSRSALRDSYDIPMTSKIVGSLGLEAVQIREDDFRKRSCMRFGLGNTKGR
jgi:hypothetical protein